MDDQSADAPQRAAWLMIGFFGLGYPVGIFHLVDRRPQVIINEIGIFDRTTIRETINWEIIQDAYLMDVHGQKFICLIVDEKFEPSKRKGGAYKTGRRAEQSAGVPGTEHLAWTVEDRRAAIGPVHFGNVEGRQVAAGRDGKSVTT